MTIPGWGLNSQHSDSSHLKGFSYKCMRRIGTITQTGKFVIFQTGKFHSGNEKHVSMTSTFKRFAIVANYQVGLNRIIIICISIAPFPHMSSRALHIG